MSRKARKQPVLETHSTDELLAKARGYVPTAGNATVETLASMIAYRRLLDGDRPQDEVQMLQEAFHSLVGQECRLVVEADNGIICYRERTTGQTVGNTMHLFCLPLRPDVGDKIKL